MPTLTAGKLLTTEMLPSTRLLLFVTCAFDPIAVALVIPGAPSEPAPINVLPSSAVLDSPALSPKKEFPSAVLRLPASNPKKALLLPVVFLEPAPAPKNELVEPVLLDFPAAFPKNELPPPVVLAIPVESPRNRLPSAGTLIRTRLPAMLYCVSAFKIFAD